ncbi:MAG: BBE domain-containing protein, partial [Longimicrobiales bacterium]|nr:BBE domain-containing protein [Longimicrobiales bacterium]
ADEHPDLFWALRGGGGNFGVVTEFEIALHPVPAEVLSGQVIYPGERAAELLRFYRDTLRTAPDEFSCFPFLLRIPPLDIFPAEWHGKLAFDFVLAWFGDPGEGAAHIAPFQALGDPILDYVVPQPYAQLQQSFDAGMGKGNRWYSRAQQFDELTDEAIDALVANLDPFPGDFTTVYLAPGGGAVGRVAPDATAYPHRTSAHELHIFPGWADPGQDGEVMSWADRLHAALRAHGNGGVYVNLLGDGEPDRIPAAYRDNYRRLAELKARWDPDNVFRGNHNIPPAG